jgi:hypothetical protein
MGGSKMIDLISHGLALRKQQTVLINNPQKIRSISAAAAPYVGKKSAKSAESAVSHPQNEHSFKIIMIAENADLAGTQSEESIFAAEAVRKSCGTDAFNMNPVSSLDIVNCNACEHFTPDAIGDGFCIGERYLGIKWTLECDGRRLLYRYADRHCDKFSKLMS